MMKAVILKATAGLIVLLSVLASAYADERYGEHPEVKTFISEMVSEHGFTQAELENLFDQAVKKQKILDAISRPAERTLTWADYRKIFVTDSRINGGVTFWQENETVLNRAAEEFGVPAEIIVAIIGVETRYGGNKGSYRVLDALSTLAFDYPRRAKFFRKELKEFLLLAREQKQNPLDLVGSYAGAMGYGQFIPSSYRAYAVDYDKDTFADIWNNTEDAIGSVANYFKRHGWLPGEQVVVRSRVEKTFDESIINDSLKPKRDLAAVKAKGFVPTKPLDDAQPASAIRLEGQYGTEYWIGLQNYYVITRYNHSRLYAMAVWQLSQEIAAQRANS